MSKAKYDLRIAKKPITKAFNDLKKHGIIGRHNYLCCQSCGHHAFSCDKIENYIFYHNQCLDSFRHWGIVHMYHGLKPEQAQIVIDAFENNGMFVHWDRDHNTCISVCLNREGYDALIESEERERKREEAYRKAVEEERKRQQEEEEE
jgi:hypothetical protein|tara:strand:+ start:158 stop:601 length:444 start_codon:yes stop_codon:yes gene_type:complete